MMMTDLNLSFHLFILRFYLFSESFTMASAIDSIGVFACRFHFLRMNKGVEEVSLKPTTDHPVDEFDSELLLIIMTDYSVETE